MEDLLTLVRHPSIILPRKHIFLLSHMRAYTSLFGHIMGSNPQICGYYEMHIGYYSKKSLIRQKLIFFRKEKPKPAFDFMFDKILHNEHRIAPGILDSPSSRVIFSLRPPQQTIPSILKLYRRIDPSHEFATPRFATRYYIDRIIDLERMAAGMRQPFFYFDAEALKSSAELLLTRLGNWLSLDTPLSTRYDLQLFSSRERFGDTSENLKSGKILQQDSEYELSEIDEADMSEAGGVYESVRKKLLDLSQQECRAT